MGTGKKSSKKKEDMVLPLTEARKNIFQLVENVQGSDDVYIFTHHGRARAVLMSYEEFDSMQETIDIFTDPETAQAIWEHENKPYNPDDYVPFEQVLEELGFEIDSNGNVRDVQNRVRKKGKKKSQKD